MNLKVVQRFCFCSLKAGRQLGSTPRRLGCDELRVEPVCPSPSLRSPNYFLAPSAPASVAGGSASALAHEGWPGASGSGSAPRPQPRHGVLALHRALGRGPGGSVGSPARRGRPDGRRAPLAAAVARCLGSVFAAVSQVCRICLANSVPVRSTRLNLPPCGVAARSSAEQRGVWPVCVASRSGVAHPALLGHSLALQWLSWAVIGSSFGLHQSRRLCSEQGSERHCKQGNGSAVRAPRIFECQQSKIQRRAGGAESTSPLVWR